jgi:hypothetical protein
MGGGSAVEEGWVSIVHDLREYEALVLFSGCERAIGSLVARGKLRRFGDGVVVGTPHELDGVTDGSVYGERYISEDTLGRRNNDGVSST